MHERRQKQYLTILARQHSEPVYSLTTVNADHFHDADNLPLMLSHEGTSYTRCASGIFFDWLVSGNTLTGIEFYLSVTLNKRITDLLRSVEADSQNRLAFHFTPGRPEDLMHLEAMDLDSYIYSHNDDIIILAGLDFLDEDLVISLKSSIRSILELGHSQ